MVVGTFLLSMLVLIDRIAISVAKDPMTAELKLTDKQFGWVLSIFALGYALFQTPFGMLADRFGSRKILTAVVSIWSFFTALTGAVSSYISLFVVRFLFGIGEAGAYPGIAKAVYHWVPIRERGIVNGINFSGGRFGAAFSLPIIALIIDAVGWRLSFVILGLVGMAWVTLWFILFRDKPEDHKWISDFEKEDLKKSKALENSQTQTESKVALAAILKTSAMWKAMGQYFASNFTFFFCLTWLFPHLKTQFMLSDVEAGFYASVPLLAGAVGNIFSGWLVDLIYRRYDKRWSRVLPAIIGFGLAAFGLLMSLVASDISVAIVFLSLAVFGADMTLSPSWTFCVDIGKLHAGAVSGTMNMAGNMGSFVTALAFPYLKDWTGSVTPFFVLGAILNVMAIFLWLRMKPKK